MLFFGGLVVYAQEGTTITVAPGDSTKDLGNSEQTSFTLDSLPTESSSDIAEVSLKQAAGQWLESVKTPMQRIFSWPFEHVVQPVFQTLMYPVIPPIRYINRHKLLPRGAELINFGDSNNVFVYPTFVIAGGSASLIGMQYIHFRLPYEVDNQLKVGGRIYANSDLKYWARYRHNSPLPGVKWAEIQYSGRADQDKSLYSAEDGRNAVIQDSGWSSHIGFQHKFYNNQSLEWRGGILARRFSPMEMLGALRPDELNHSDWWGDSRTRGVEQNYNVGFVRLAWSRNSRDYSYMPTKGSKQSVQVSRAWVGDYYGEYTDEWYNEKTHNYTRLILSNQSYFLLGEKKYRLSGKESKENEEFFTRFSISRALDLFGWDQVRNTLLQRKVLLWHMRLERVWEDEKYYAPFDAFPALGMTTPLRGYGALQRFPAPAIIASGLEYRWPLVRYIDGVFFLEYGSFANTLTSWKSENLRNSWGMGIRVRTPTFFLFRVQTGFHGAQGVNFVVESSAAF